MPTIVSVKPWESLLVALVVLLAGPPVALRAQDNPRMTPLVSAVAKARPAVVNIRGSKTVANDSPRDGQLTKQVNGMGTGIVIDSRGFVLTNYHVVQDVSQIRVSTSTRETVTGELIAHDERTDLALVRIHAREPLTAIPLGTSNTIMLAESVAAIGNAYGYEHTVTEGIVSELGRTVQVSDDQIYYDLIQTDASINPGNSGGPLLNLEGDMIGINVAVRVGAQGIAFAIPVNDAIEVAANLMKQVAGRSANSGLTVETKYDGPHVSVQVAAVEPNSSAAEAGLRVGDELCSVCGVECHRALDVYRTFVDKSPRDEIEFTYNRDHLPQTATCQLKPSNFGPVRLASTSNSGELAWSLLGIEVVELPREAMRRINASYDGGLRVVQVRPNSPAERENLRVGDVLVAMAEWKTETADNLKYILQQPHVAGSDAFKFYIFRNNEPLYGQIRIAQASNVGQ